MKNLLKNGDDSSPDVAAPNVVLVRDPVPGINPGPVSTGFEAGPPVPAPVAVYVSDVGEDGRELVVIGVISIFSFVVVGGLGVAVPDGYVFKPVAAGVLPSSGGGEADGDCNRGMLVSWF